MKKVTFALAFSLTAFTGYSYAGAHDQHKLIITPSQVFYGCEQATLYEKNILPALIAHEEKRVANGIPQKYKQLEDSYRKSLNRLRTELKAAKSDQYKKLITKASVELAFIVIGEGIGKNISKMKLSARDKGILETVAAKSNLQGKALADMSLDRFDAKAFSIDFVLNNVELLARTVVKFSPPTAVAIRTIQFSKLGADLFLDHRDSQLDINVLQASIDSMVSAVNKLYEKSPTRVLADLKDTQRRIKDECVPGALLERR